MRTLWLFIAAVCISLTTSCGNHRKSADWRSSDDVHIAIDETFRDIMEEELETFTLLHPEAGMKPTYCSEDSAIRMLVADSVRCCIATRRLTDREEQIIKSHKLGVKQALIATDAFALIVNKATPDTLLTLDDIRGIVSGRITRWEQLTYVSGKRGELKLVFDHSGSSTVRYMRDSLCNGKELKGNLYAQGNNRAVIDAVKADPDIIGVVGANWLKSKGGSVVNDFDTLDVKVLKVARKAEENVVGWRPYQVRIATGDYPLIRSVYVILTDPRVRSFTKTFFFFLKGQKGQNIINNNSQMLTIMPVQIKDVNIREE